MVGSSSSSLRLGAACVLGDGKCELQSIKRRLYNWEEGKCTREDGVIIFRDDAHKECEKHLAIIDAKSLYDSLRREARGREPRVAIAVGEIKQSLVAANCSIRGDHVKL